MGYSLFADLLGCEADSLVKIDVENFDGRINFDLWQLQAKDVLIQFGLQQCVERKTE